MKSYFRYIYSEWKKHLQWEHNFFTNVQQNFIFINLFSDNILNGQKQNLNHNNVQQLTIFSQP